MRVGYSYSLKKTLNDASRLVLKQRAIARGYV